MINDIEFSVLVGMSDWKCNPLDRCFRVREWIESLPLLYSLQSSLKPFYWQEVEDPEAETETPEDEDPEALTDMPDVDGAKLAIEHWRDWRDVSDPVKKKIDKLDNGWGVGINMLGEIENVSCILFNRSDCPNSSLLCSNVDSILISPRITNVCHNSSI